MRMDWIRHGETPGNRERRYVGTTDEDLTPEAARAARRLHPVVPPVVFCSPRRRCRSTAALLYPARTPVIVEEFAECDFGRWEYRNAGELADDPDYRAWLASGGTAPFPGGESREEFEARCLRGFARAVEQMRAQGWDFAAFVVHGGTIMALLDALSEPHRDYFDWQCPNLTILSTDYEYGKLRLRTADEKSTYE